MKKVLSSWRTERYKTSNWAQYNAALRERGSLTLWFDPTMQWGAKPALLHKERSVWFEGRGESLNDINVLASSNEESAKQLAYRTI